jgi:hypothetical protein
LADSVTGYYISTPGNKPSQITGGTSKWYTILVKKMQSAVNTRQNQMKQSLPEGPAPTNKPAPAQKKRKEIATRCSS